jgi:hypothetical protein
VAQSGRCGRSDLAQLVQHDSTWNSGCHGQLQAVAVGDGNTLACAQRTVGTARGVGTGMLHLGTGARAHDGEKMAGWAGPFQCGAMEESGRWPRTNFQPGRTGQVGRAQLVSFLLFIVFSNELSNASNFNLSNTILLKSKILQTWHGWRIVEIRQNSFLDQLPKLSRF